MNNMIKVVGQVVTEPLVEFRNTYGVYFSFIVSCPRTSGTIDYLKVIIESSKMKKGAIEIKVEDYVSLYGDIRTKMLGTKLQVFQFVKHVDIVPPQFEGVNIVKLEGTICKPVINRITPRGRHITDIVLAVNSFKGKSSYIPLISWGTHAGYLADFKVGDKIAVSGRLQSREYEKERVKKVSYEVSITDVTKLEFIENDGVYRSNIGKHTFNISN